MEKKEYTLDDFKSLKVVKVEINGLMSWAPLIQENEKEIREAFKEETGLELPPSKYFEKNDTVYRFATNDFLIGVLLEGGVMITLKIEKGFSTDLASSPKPVRSYVDNDSQDIFISSVIHDALFKGKFFGESKEAFELANELFDELNKYYRMRRVKRWAVLKAVQSRKGWNIYKRKAERDSKDWLRCSLSIDFPEKESPEEVK